MENNLFKQIPATKCNERNWFIYSKECVLFTFREFTTMLTNDEPTIRTQALRRILKIRNQRQNNIGVRKCNVTEIYFETNEYYKMQLI